MIIKPIYTMKDMREFLNYKSSEGVRRFLFKLNIPMYLVGGKWIIYLADLQNYAPNFYNSILEANSLNSLIDHPLPKDDDTHTPNQFK